MYQLHFRTKYDLPMSTFIMGLSLPQCKTAFYSEIDITFIYTENNQDHVTCDDVRVD